MEHSALKVLSWSGLATAGLALSPVVLPAVTSSSAVAIAGAEAVRFCTSGVGSGLAGAAANFLGQIPLIGSTVAAGGFATAAMSGGLAMGGMLLANYLDKRTEQGAFRWGAVIRWASLTTSILIALPAILPAISMGAMFFASVFSSSALYSAALAIGSLGGAGASSAVGGAASAAGLAALHAVTCALPLGLTGFFLGQKEEPKKPMPQLQLPALTDGRLMQPMPLARAAA